MVQLLPSEPACQWLVSRAGKAAALPGSLDRHQGLSQAEALQKVIIFKDGPKTLMLVDPCPWRVVLKQSWFGVTTFVVRSCCLKGRSGIYLLPFLRIWGCLISWEAVLFGVLFCKPEVIAADLDRSKILFRTPRWVVRWALCSSAVHKRSCCGSLCLRGP